MKDIKIGDKVKFNDNYMYMEGYIVGIDTLSGLFGYRYLVNSKEINEIGAKMHNITLWSYEEVKAHFTKKDRYILTPYDGYAIWTNDVEKVEEVKEELKDCEFEELNNCMELKFNLGQNVMYKGEKHKVIGIDKTNIGNSDYCYLINTNTMDSAGQFYEFKEYLKDCDVFFLDNIPDDTDCRWVEEEDLEKLESKSAGCDSSEEYIRTEFDKIREQKRQTIKEMSEKVLGLTLEIKEIEAEIEKIKKEWHL